MVGKGVTAWYGISVFKYQGQLKYEIEIPWTVNFLLFGTGTPKVLILYFVMRYFHFQVFLLCRLTIASNARELKLSHMWRTILFVICWKKKARKRALVYKIHSHIYAHDKVPVRQRAVWSWLICEIPRTCVSWFNNNVLLFNIQYQVDVQWLSATWGFLLFIPPSLSSFLRSLAWTGFTMWTKSFSY